MWHATLNNTSNSWIGQGFTVEQLFWPRLQRWLMAFIERIQVCLFVIFRWFRCFEQQNCHFLQRNKLIWDKLICATQSIFREKYRFHSRLSEKVIQTGSIDSLERKKYAIRCNTIMGWPYEHQSEIFWSEVQHFLPQDTLKPQFSVLFSNWISNIRKKFSDF